MNSSTVSRSTAPRRSASRRHTYIILVVGLLFVLQGVFLIGLPPPETSIHDHHIEHLFYMVGGALWGVGLAQLLLGDKDRMPRDETGRPRIGHSAWLIAAILAPAAVMFLMWPSMYEYIEARPWIHAWVHLWYVILSVVTTFAGYMFSKSAGWVLSAVVGVMAWAAAFGFGVENQHVHLPTPEAAPMVNGQVDGAAVYQNCASCHQPNGEGLPGSFPPLAGHLSDLLGHEGGANYVANVLVYGLQGSIEVNGDSYNGVMPSWGHLSDAELAAVVDYVVTSWGGDTPAGKASLSAAQIKQVRGQNRSADDVHRLREKLG